MRVDGSAVDSLSAVEARPLVSVFLPERLELVKGAPAARRAHLDQVVAALWPSRAETRSAYSRALAQRNALVARIRAGAAGPGGARRLGRRAGPPRDPADGRTARRPSTASGRCSPSSARSLGLPGEAELRYRPRSPASDAEGLAAELAERRAGRPRARLHRPRAAPRRAPAPARTALPLRAYGSQGQQRAALLALLFAERALLAERRAPPAADAARRRDVGARRRAPRAARGPAALRRPGGDHRRPSPSTCRAPRSPAAG